MAIRRLHRSLLCGLLCGGQRASPMAGDQLYREKNGRWMPITHITSSGDLVGTLVRDIGEIANEVYQFSQDQVNLINDMIDALGWSAKEATDSVRKVIQNGSTQQLAPSNKD